MKKTDLYITSNISSTSFFKLSSNVLTRLFLALNIGSGYSTILSGSSNCKSDAIQITKTQKQNLAINSTILQITNLSSKHKTQNWVFHLSVLTYFALTRGYCFFSHGWRASPSLCINRLKYTFITAGGRSKQTGGCEGTAELRVEKRCFAAKRGENCAAEGGRVKARWTSHYHKYGHRHKLSVCHVPIKAQILCLCNKTRVLKFVFLF